MRATRRRTLGDQMEAPKERPARAPSGPTRRRTTRARAPMGLVMEEVVVAAEVLRRIVERDIDRGHGNRSRLD